MDIKLEEIGNGLVEVVLDSEVVAGCRDHGTHRRMVSTAWMQEIASMNVSTKAIGVDGFAPELFGRRILRCEGASGDLRQNSTPYGHGVGQAIRQSSADLLQMERGSLYPALHRLEAQGFISSE
jgi:hypothetical protein